MKHDTTPRSIDVTFTVKQITRFWSFVQRQETGCWEWQGAKNKSGYGVVFFGNKNYRAHRISWLLTNGQILDGMVICHACDNPGCVRPDHLSPGTPIENHNDMKHKGRSPEGDRNGRHTKPESFQYVRGESHPNSKLTNDIVREIRRRYVRTAPYRTNAREIAHDLDLPTSTVTAIGDRAVWKHVDDAVI